jgi:hypothetical protein
MGTPTHRAEDGVERGARIPMATIITSEAAFAAYAKKALLRFDLEGTTEMIRQQLERISVWDALGDYSMSDSIRNVVEQERDHQIDLSAALEEGAPAAGDVNRVRSRRTPARHPCGSA